MSDESFLERRRAINRRAAAKSRRRLKEHTSRVKSEYYAAQCTNTKLKYEKKQLERRRDQLLGQWRMHDAVVCRRTSSTSTLHAVSSSTGELSTHASTFDLLSAFPVLASGSTAAEELDLFGIGSPFDIEDDDDDDDDDDTDDGDAEEDTDIISESVMADLSDIYDPLSRSLTSCPVAADRDDASLMGFDAPPLSVFNEPVATTSRTATAAAAAGQAMTPRTRGLAGSRVRPAARSRSLSLTSVGPAIGDARRIHSETSRVDDWTTATQCTSTTTTQSSVTNIPLHVRSLSSDRDDDD